MRGTAYHITKFSVRRRGWRISSKLPIAKSFVSKSEKSFLFGKRASNRELDIAFRAPIVLCHVFVHGRGDGSAIVKGQIDTLGWTIYDYEVVNNVRKTLTIPLSSVSGSYSGNMTPIPSQPRCQLETMSALLLHEQ